MQPAGRDVRAAAELAAGVQLREDDFHAGQPGLGLGIDRNATPVVVDLDRAVGVQRDDDLRAVVRECLVDSVVDDLPEAVHEAPRVRGPDVHARALANGLETLQHGQVTSGVVTGVGPTPRRRTVRRCGAHAPPVSFGCLVRWAVSPGYPWARTVLGWHAEPLGGPIRGRVRQDTPRAPKRRQRAGNGSGLLDVVRAATQT